MRTLELTKGYKTKIDNEDYEKLLAWDKWHPGSSPLQWCVSFEGGVKNPKPYAVKRIKNKVTRLHRFIYELNNIPIPKGMEIDHINGDTLDNRKQNLRLVNSWQNKANSRPKSSTGYKGVYPTENLRKPFGARIKLHNIQYSLGRFMTAEEAAKAYDIKARELFGEFAYLNFP